MFEIEISGKFVQFKLSAHGTIVTIVRSKFFASHSVH